MIVPKDLPSDPGKIDLNHATKRVGVMALALPCFGNSSFHSNTKLEQQRDRTEIVWETVWELQVLMIAVCLSGLLGGTWTVLNPGPCSDTCIVQVSIYSRATTSSADSPGSKTKLN